MHRFHWYALWHDQPPPPPSPTPWSKGHSPDIRYMIRDRKVNEIMTNVYNPVYICWNINWGRLVQVLFHRTQDTITCKTFYTNRKEFVTETWWFNIQDLLYVYDHLACLQTWHKNFSQNAIILSTEVYICITQKLKPRLKSIFFFT